MPSEADARARRGSTVASAFDLSIVLGLLVLLSLWWGLVSLLGVFMTTELAQVAKLARGLPWWADLIVLLGAAVAASTPLVLIVAIQRLNRRETTRSASMAGGDPPECG